MATPVRQGREFTGGVVPESMPVVIRPEHVEQVHMFDVPAGIREIAAYALGDISGGMWWTVGEFRYAGDREYTTAVARRVGAQIQYGIESY